MDDELADLHDPYLGGPVLGEGDLDPDPLVELRRWLTDAIEAGVMEPHAMVLATADAEGRPSARNVLLKGLDHRGLQFFTNRRSRKGRGGACVRKALLLFGRSVS